MKDNKEQDEILDKIKVFSSEDERLKILGELLSNKSSRDIIRLLIEKEMYTNEIAKKLELRVSLVIHHLKKMESIGLLDITNKKIIRKGEVHRFFKIPSGMLILPNETKEPIKGVINKIFKTGIKFVVIGIASLVPLTLQIALTKIENSNIDSDRNLFPTTSILMGLVIIIIGLVIERIHRSRKK